MSVIESIKSMVGIEEDHPTYECVECGNTFESVSGPGSHWFHCPECGSEDPLGNDPSA